MGTGEPLKAQQRDQWSAAASAWERNDAWLEEHLGVLSRKLCDDAKISAGQQVLDLACGAGEPSSIAAARVGPTGRVVATDLSPDMVAATRRKHQRLGFDHVEVREMDAENIAFPDGTFDVVTCRFGLMFCPDPARAAAEILRVLKPGGKLSAAVWDEPARNPFFTAVGQVIAKYVPAPPPDPKAPGVFRLAPPGELAGILKGAGFKDVRVEPMPLTFSYRSPEAYWELQSQLAAPLRAAVATLPPDKLAELREAVLGVARANVVDGLVRFKGTPLVALATR